jgi:hypothetical protein
VERFAQLTPGSASLLTMQAWLTSVSRDLPGSVRAWQQLRERFGESPVVRRTATLGLAQALQKQGRMAEASTLMREAMADAEEAKEPADYLETAASLSLLNAAYPSRGDPAAPLTDALARHPLASLDPLDRPYSWIVFAFARAGRQEEARRLRGEYEAMPTRSRPGAGDTIRPASAESAACSRSPAPWSGWVSRTPPGWPTSGW